MNNKLTTQQSQLQQLFCQQHQMSQLFNQQQRLQLQPPHFLRVIYIMTKNGKTSNIPHLSDLN
jgi:hypothetical protein